MGQVAGSGLAGAHLSTAHPYLILVNLASHALITGSILPNAVRQTILLTP